MATKSNKKKNPLKSGNPAVVAQARAKLESHGSTSAEKKVSKREEATFSRGFEPSASLPSSSSNETVRPINRNLYSPRKNKWRKAGEIGIIVSVLLGLVLTSFSGLFGQSTAPIQDTGTNSVLVDENGQPLDGSAPVTDSAEVGSGLPTSIPTPIETEGILELPAEGGGVNEEVAPVPTEK